MCEREVPGRTSPTTGSTGPISPFHRAYLPLDPPVWVNNSLSLSAHHLFQSLPPHCTIDGKGRRRTDGRLRGRIRPGLIRRIFTSFCQAGTPHGSDRVGPLDSDSADALRPSTVASQSSKTATVWPELAQPFWDLHSSKINGRSFPLAKHSEGVPGPRTLSLEAVQALVALR